MAARSPEVRTDDLAAVPIRALIARNPKVDWAALDEVVLGCANQAGEDNRNVARMALLLAGLPDGVPGVTVNRLCASGLNAVGDAARAIRAGEIELAIAGGVESMTPGAVRDGQGRRGVPAHGRDARHHHRLALHQSADEGAIRRRCHAGDRRERRRRTTRSRAPTRTPSRCARSSAPARRRPPAISPQEIVPVEVQAARPGPSSVDNDEHPRPDTTLEALAKLKPIVRDPGTVTAGNASGVNDGAAAMILARKPPPRATASRRARACSAWRRPGCRRASWASVRCRRPAS